MGELSANQVIQLRSDPAAVNCRDCVDGGCDRRLGGQATDDEGDGGQQTEGLEQAGGR